MDDELITRNPCRIKGAGKERAAERRIATVAQVDALAEAVGMRWRLMVYLGAYGPLRPEELAGLRRRDVDLDNLRVRVRLAEPERMNGRRVQGDTKSEAGTRTVILPAFLRQELRWHLESYAEPGPDGLIFVGEKGAPFRRSTFGRRWPPGWMRPCGRRGPLPGKGRESRSPTSLLAGIWHSASDRSGQQNGPGL